jgi:hypothetical protein
MKKRSLFFILTAFFISGPLLAQPGKRIEKINSQKVAFITEELNLNVKEAQEFWPVYNELSDKLELIKTKKAELYLDEIRGHTKISEEESLVVIDKYMDYELDEVNLKKEYHDKFKKVLPANKVMKLYIAENKFKLFLLNKLKDNKSSLFDY